MKLHLLSDLHLEFASFTPPATEADVVVFAGDVDEGTAGLTWARAAFPHQQIVYVAGNHEYYRHKWAGLPGQMRKVALGLGIHLLEDEAVVLGGVRFLGATLWTDYALFGSDRIAKAQAVCRQGMTDFKNIRVDAQDNPGYEGKNAWRSRELTPTMVRARHLRSRAWLEAQLALPFEGMTLVVTHHLPSKHSLHPYYLEDFASAAYASNLESMMGRCALWLHGHTHDSCDHLIKGTRIVCNPRGYWTLSGDHVNPSFDPGRILTVE